MEEQGPQIKMPSELSGEKGGGIAERNLMVPKELIKQPNLYIDGKTGQTKPQKLVGDLEESSIKEREEEKAGYQQLLEEICALKGKPKEKAAGGYMEQSMVVEKVPKARASVMAKAKATAKEKIKAQQKQKGKRQRMLYTRRERPLLQRMSTRG